MLKDSRLYGGQDPFIYHAPSDNQVARITNVRNGCQAMLQILLTNLEESHERTLAIRKLEEVSMWANKAIVFE